MAFFEYDPADKKAEYYEKLQSLMKNWEKEIVEFKEAKGHYDLNQLGRYFSAISNEANLHDIQYGWFVLGVSEEKKKYPVGTHYKEGSETLLEKLKYEIAKETTDGITFMDIIEIFPVYEGEAKRVLMFKIPAAVTGIPTGWKSKYYGRDGESLVELNQEKIDRIRMQERRDWSKQIIHGSKIEYLDSEAIKFARSRYIERMNRPHITEEIEKLSDEEFLTKIKLMRDGSVTNAGMILLGNPEYDYLFENAPEMMWRLYGADDVLKDYQIYKIPFILSADQIFAKIRNLTYRYMTRQMSLFPEETEYDSWMLRELIHNCIAHSNYQLGGRIYINESEDNILITNPGDFLPQSIQNVLSKTYSPPYYRNRLLVDAMVMFHMIDTATSGIKKVYRIQKDKYFPLPDYDLHDKNQVSVRIYGKILDENYTYLLYDHPEFDMRTIFLLDQVQKGNGRNLQKDEIAYLRKHNLVEGRINHLFLSAETAKVMNEEIEYVKNRGFHDKYYKDLIIELIQQKEQVQRKDIRKLLWNKLPDSYSDKQKEQKISTLLTSLRKAGKIKKDSDNQQLSHWVLVGDDEK